MSSVSTKVRHVIEVCAPGRRGVDEFEFWSRDGGGTQVSTVRWEGHLVAQFLPGTRHWDTALEVAEKLLAAAFGRLDTSGGGWEWEPFLAAFQAAMAEQRCQAWPGNWEEEGL